MHDAIRTQVHTDHSPVVNGIHRDAAIHAIAFEEHWPQAGNAAAVQVGLESRAPDDVDVVVVRRADRLARQRVRRARVYCVRCGDLRRRNASTFDVQDVDLICDTWNIPGPGTLGNVCDHVPVLDQHHWVQSAVL